MRHRPLHLTDPFVSSRKMWSVGYERGGVNLGKKDFGFDSRLHGWSVTIGDGPKPKLNSVEFNTAGKVFAGWLETKWDRDYQGIGHYGWSIAGGIIGDKGAINYKYGISLGGYRSIIDKEISTHLIKDYIKRRPWYDLPDSETIQVTGYGNMFGFIVETGVHTWLGSFSIAHTLVGQTEAFSLGPQDRDSRAIEKENIFLMRGDMEIKLQTRIYDTNHVVLEAKLPSIWSVADPNGAKKYTGPGFARSERVFSAMAVGKLPLKRTMVVTAKVEAFDQGGKSNWRSMVNMRFDW